MKASRGALVGALASAALLGSVAAGFAQSPSAQHGRLIEVPPGAVLIVLPAGGAPVTTISVTPCADEFAFPAMPSAAAMIHEMDQMMADMQRAFLPPAWFSPDRVIEAATRGLPSVSGPFASVVVTTFSDGRGTCTERVIYDGHGAAPKMQVASSGTACAAVGLPAQQPGTPLQQAAPQHLFQVKAVHPAAPAPRLIQVQDRSRTVPLVYAQAGE